MIECAPVLRLVPAAVKHKLAHVVRHAAPRGLLHRAAHPLRRPRPSAQPAAAPRCHRPEGALPPGPGAAAAKLAVAGTAVAAGLLGAMSAQEAPAQAMTGLDAGDVVNGLPGEMSSGGSGLMPAPLFPSAGDLSGSAPFGAGAMPASLAMTLPPAFSPAAGIPAAFAAPAGGTPGLPDQGMLVPNARFAPLGPAASEVPEPSCLVLFGTAAVLLLVARGLLQRPGLSIR
ncbi:MAG TPA: hypothetical protein VGC80_08895 [Acetobacteraceae bacterium]